MLTQVASLAQASSWLQQLCFAHVVHASSVEAGEHAEPASAPVLPLLHAVSHLLEAHDARLAKLTSSSTHCVQVPAAEHPSSHDTQVSSLLQAVASVQHCWARHVAHALVPVIAGHELLPDPELDPEPEQLPLDEPPPPIPPPMPPVPVPVDEQEGALLPDEHPAMTTVTTRASVASLGRVRRRECESIIGPRNTETRRSTTASSPHFRCGLPRLVYRADHFARL